MHINLDGAERYIQKLSPNARSQMETALRSTIHHMLGIRNGACYRYESEIKTAKQVIQEDNHGTH